MGVKTAVVTMVPAAAHVTAAVKAGQNIMGLQAQAGEMINELLVVLRQLQATMQTGDANITAINNQISALT